MIVLAVGAHPDDIEISCAGTLAKLKKAGHEVVICHACTGDKGHYVIPPDELRVIRAEEARQAGAVIGSRVLSLGFPDCEIFSDNMESRVRFVDLIREVRPDIVITHAPNDYMPDHVAVSKLVFDATFVATVPSFKTGRPAAEKIPALFFMDNLSGLDFQPTLYVDVTDTFGTKIEMLKKHQSQLVWLKEHDNVDIVDFVTCLGKMRGIQAGVAYAEGFIRHTVWTRPNATPFPV